MCVRRTEFGAAATWYLAKMKFLNTVDAMFNALSAMILLAVLSRR